MTSTEYMIELAKLKAKELYNTFHQMVEIDTTDGDGITREYSGNLLDEYKKQFAKVVEAAEIAVKAGQVFRNFLHNPKIGLFSEDLY